MGTSVELRLKPVDVEAGIEDYTVQWVLARIIKRYADFVSYPITYLGPAVDPADHAAEPERTATPIVLNSMKPIWTRPESEVRDDEYNEFYRHITHDWVDPQLRTSFKAEGAIGICRAALRPCARPLRPAL